MGTGSSREDIRRISLTNSPVLHTKKIKQINGYQKQRSWPPTEEEQYIRSRNRPAEKSSPLRQQRHHQPNILNQNRRRSQSEEIPSSNNSHENGNIVRSESEENLAAKRREWQESTSKRIHVVIRARPLNIKEIKEDSRDVLFMDEINNECTILVPKTRKTMAAQGGNPNKSVTFSFDRCYNNKTTTAQMYNEIPYSLVQSVLEGYNATIMAYGQTGSGKSFTMQEDPDHIGIIPRAIVHVFEGKEADEDRDTQYYIHTSYVEIYNEEIRDLLSDNPEKKLEIKGNAVQDLTMHHVETIGHCAELLKTGISKRITSATYMNAHSSRSHAIFTVWVKVIYTDPGGHKHYRKGKLNLVDLAGSERHGKTGITTDDGQNFKESKSINLSLTTLGKVIQSLSNNKPGHVPYRESKLTRLLQDSLGGNSRTLMVACLSPSDRNYEESLSTLKFAHNTKFINIKPVVNEELDPKDELIKELQGEIKFLRNRLKE